MVIRRPLLRALVPLVAVGALAACSNGEPAGDEAQFCGEVDANLRALTKPTLKTEADVAAVVGLYRDLGDVAPLAIEEQWNALTTLYETASTVDTSDRGLAPAGQRAGVPHRGVSGRAEALVEAALPGQLARDHDRRPRREGPGAADHDRPWLNPLSISVPARTPQCAGSADTDENSVRELLPDPTD